MTTEYNRLREKAIKNGWPVPAGTPLSFYRWLKYWAAKDAGRPCQMPTDGVEPGNGDYPKR